MTQFFYHLYVILRLLNIQVQKEIHPGIPNITGIRALLIRVFINAINYLGLSMQPKETIYINGNVTKDGDEIEIKIKNNNSDIAIDEFKPFREVFRHINEREDMPLYISNMILESHAGYLEMGEKEGEGRVIKIHLPFNRDEMDG